MNLFQARESLASYIPAGDGKNYNFFYSAMENLFYSLWFSWKRFVVQDICFISLELLQITYFICFVFTPDVFVQVFPETFHLKLKNLDFNEIFPFFLTLTINMQVRTSCWGDAEPTEPQRQ
jgi:hypothetical protein